MTHLASPVNNVTQHVILTNYLKSFYNKICLEILFQYFNYNI